jgi:very-short-patch-repair endonuclease
MKSAYPKSDAFTMFVHSVTGYEVEMEYKFHPVRKWRFDYCIHVLKLAIEVEGGAYTQGRHTRGAGFISDCEKYNSATCLGWRLIRVTPSQLMTMQTIEYIKQIARL